MPRRSEEPPPGPIRDLPDFYLRWPEYRETALAVAESPRLDPAEREVVLWLTRLADKIGDRDFDSRIQKRP